MNTNLPVISGAEVFPSIKRSPESVPEASFIAPIENASTVFRERDWIVALILNGFWFPLVLKEPVAVILFSAPDNLTSIL